MLKHAIESLRSLGYTRYCCAAVIRTGSVTSNSVVERIMSRVFRGSDLNFIPNLMLIAQDWTTGCVVAEGRRAAISVGLWARFPNRMLGFCFGDCFALAPYRVRAQQAHHLDDDFFSLTNRLSQAVSCTYALILNR